MSTLKVDTIQKADGTGSLSVPAESGTVVTTASPSLGRRNLIINGAMQVWQRSTSATLASSGTYLTADRWKYWASMTYSSARNSFTAGQTDVPNFEFYNSITVASNSAAGDYATFNHHVENVILSDAQTFTLSFYAKASQSWTIGIEPIQNFGSGGSTRVTHTPENITVGTTWQRHTVTFTTDSISGKTLGTGHNFEINFWLSGGSDLNARTGSIGNQSGTFDITGVQLEVGSVATPFEHRSFGEELALCQRYYWKLAGDGDYHGIGAGGCISSIRFRTYINHPVPMRSSPTYSFGGTLYFSQGTDVSPTAIDGGYDKFIDFATTGATAGNGGAFITGNTSSDYIQADAEL